MKALSMTEASEYIDAEELSAFVKKFVKITPEEARKMRAEIEKLENIKIKDEHVAKMIDLLPEDSQDIAKIFSDVSLDEQETSQLLEIVKKYR